MWIISFSCRIAVGSDDMGVNRVRRSVANRSLRHAHGAELQLLRDRSVPSKGPSCCDCKTLTDFLSHHHKWLRILSPFNNISRNLWYFIKACDNKELWTHHPTTKGSHRASEWLTRDETCGSWSPYDRVSAASMVLSLHPQIISWATMVLTKWQLILFLYQWYF